MSLAIMSTGTGLENVSTMSRATFVVLLCSLLALFNFLYSVCHDYGFESGGRDSTRRYIRAIGGSFMINYVCRYVRT